MASRSSKIVGRIGGTEKMTARCKTVLKDIHTQIKEEIDIKLQMLSDLADKAAKILSSMGNANLELSEDDGLGGFFYTPLMNLIEEESQIPVFSGIGDGGWEYKLIVKVTMEEEDTLSSEVMIVRLKGEKAELLTDDGWEEGELEFSEE